jgi:hypothetical protein
MTYKPQKRNRRRAERMYQVQRPELREVDNACFQVPQEIPRREALGHARCARVSPYAALPVMAFPPVIA